VIPVSASSRDVMWWYTTVSSARSGECYFATVLFTNKVAMELSRRFRYFAATELSISLFLSFMPTRLSLFFYTYSTKKTLFLNR